MHIPSALEPGTSTSPRGSTDSLNQGEWVQASILHVSWNQLQPKTEGMQWGVVWGGVTITHFVYQVLLLGGCWTQPVRKQIISCPVTPGSMAPSPG